MKDKRTPSKQMEDRTKSTAYSSKERKTITQIIVAAWYNNEKTDSVWERLSIELNRPKQSLQRYWGLRLHEVLADVLQLGPERQTKLKAPSKKYTYNVAFNGEAEDSLIRRAAAFLSNQGPEVCCFLGTVLHKSHWSIRQRCWRPKTLNSCRQDS